MNPQEQSQSLAITQIDNELIYDKEHILMNYLKMNSFSQNCFSNTNIKISPSILNASFPSETVQNFNQFSTKYFTLFLQYENAIDILCPMILDYHNSEFGLFLTTVLKNHVIEISQSLDNLNDKFNKYKNYLTNLYQSIIKVNNKQILLENICSSITVLIVVGINGNWKDGLELLIGAAKENNGGDCGNVLMASFIISNIYIIFEKLKEKLESKNIENIASYIKGYSNIIQEFTNFLITGAFNGPKDNFVNTPLFKAFIGIIQSFKYFDINIIKIHGFLDFLINCISYINVDHDFIVQICDIFEFTFSSKSNIGLIFESKAKYSIGHLVSFLDNVSSHKDFKEIKKSIELIMNVKNFYSNKAIKEIKSNPKDLQILFASCRIFSHLIENFHYIFFIPDIDTLVQDIYLYFISLPIYNISQILLDSLSPVVCLIHNGYKFNNYSKENNLQNTKLQNFNIFLYDIHNSVFQNMKLSSMEEYNNVDFNIHPFNSIRLDKYIIEILKESISDDEKINYINGATDFYENLYEIINELYGIKDFNDKICQYLMSCINNNDLISIDCILIVFNKIAIKIKNDLPEFIFNLIDFILNGNNNQNINLLNDTRFTLEFIRLIDTMRIDISKNRKYMDLIIENLLNQKYSEEKMNLIIINIIYKLITTSYQTCKNNNKANTNNEEDKNNLMNIFNILSQYLIDNITKISYNYLLKLIDSIFASCFYNVYLGYLSNDVIYNISGKLFKDANQLFNMAVNSNNNAKNELYMKYIHMVLSIIKNLGNENGELLIGLYNKIDTNPNNINISNNNNNITYFENIKNNITIIINDCSENSQNFDNIIINSVILLCNAMIKQLKEKTSTYYYIFSNIISTIRKLNPANISEIDLTIILYKNILNYCKNSPIYTEVSEICFDTLNILNSKFKYAKKDDDKVSLSIKICEFILLYFPNFSQNFIQICDKHHNYNSQFVYSFNELINTFENNDNEDYNYAFSNLIKTFCENKIIFIGFIKDFVIRLTTAFINHLQYFKTENYKSIPYYFMIFKHFWTEAKDEFQSSLKRIFNNNNEIIYAIGMYLDNINYINYKNLEIKIQNYNKSFIKELGELLYAVDSKKKDFISKYLKILDELKRNERKGYKFDGNCEKASAHITIIHK